MSASHENLEVENECLRLQLAQAEEELRYLYSSGDKKAPGEYLSTYHQDIQAYVVRHAAPTLLAAVAKSASGPRAAVLYPEESVRVDSKPTLAFAAPRFDQGDYPVEEKYRNAELAGLHEELDRRWETIERLNAENLDLSRRQTLLDIEISNLEAQLELVKSLFFDERGMP